MAGGLNGRRAWIVCCAFVALSSPLAATGADGPLGQDDAGSGRDAPDDARPIVPIAPDVVYEGTSTGPAFDAYDLFFFNATAGDTFSGWADGSLGCYDVLDAQGSPLPPRACSYAHAPANSGPVELELPHTGLYYLRIAHLAPASYRFVFNLSGQAPNIETIPLRTEDPRTPLTLPVPDGCHDGFDRVTDTIGTVERFTDECYHMRTGLNGLDSPMIDVLLVPPATIHPERDLRTMRQAIEMWDRGIHGLAPQMGLDWLAEGVDFDILVDDDAVSTDPLWDPDIVVVVTNPVGGVGIGIDPLKHLFGLDGPSHGQPNPLAGLDVWSRLPGFDDHHDRGGTYKARCEGGGTVCFAVNGAIDPAPGIVDIFDLFDLVAHEVGHCLTIGHVGDARDHKANNVPEADIMAYADPPHLRCVSTLDVISFALSMSWFLLETPLAPNDGDSKAGRFQIQHPDDHRYASSTGLATDCPQPDADLVPGGNPKVDVQDDAGSGRDAPDEPRNDVSVRPGILYEGNIAGYWIDDADHYHLEGEAGQSFRGWSDGHVGDYALLDAQGEVIGLKTSLGHSVNGGVLTEELPYTGDYYLRIQGLTPSLYRFAFTLDGAPPDVRLLTPQDDAGSGHDAPDDISDDVTVYPDLVYEGRTNAVYFTTTPATNDQYDVYHLAGQEGQVFQGWWDGPVGSIALLDRSGTVVGQRTWSQENPAQKEPIVVPLPHTGDFYLRISSWAPAVYRFGFSLEGEAPRVGPLPPP